MEISKKPWPILSVCGFKSRIDTNPDFQRPAVWSNGQKQLLIDTILRGYDIPKLYWRKVSKTPEKYEVVDGQQRLRTIFEFHGGEFPLARDADDIDGAVIAKLSYNDLPEDVRLRFDNYALDVIVLSDTSDDEVREMFLRLQNGTSLKAQEKRNAMPGNMRALVKDLAQHPFFQRCAFANARLNYDLVAAQMTAIELNGGPCHVRNANLNSMYDAQQQFDSGSPKARKIRRVLEYLAQTFPEKTPELERYSVLSLYTLVSHCLEKYVFQGRQDSLREWFLHFETERAAQDALPEDKRDPELLAYRERTSHSTDAQDSIQWRHDFLLRKFFEAVPDIEQKDPQRLFSHEQRLAIFRRQAPSVSSSSNAKASSASGTPGRRTTASPGRVEANPRWKTDRWLARPAIPPKARTPEVQGFALRPSPRPASSARLSRRDGRDLRKSPGSSRRRLVCRGRCTGLPPGAQP